MRRYDLILFDLDGTLVETAPEICDAVNDTLQHFEFANVSQIQVNDWIGLSSKEKAIRRFAILSAYPRLRLFLRRITARAAARAATVTPMSWTPCTA